MGDKGRQRWNHNIHYHQLVLDAVPVKARSAVDVGAGDGLLAADLCQKVPKVVAIDIDDQVVQSARTSIVSDDITWIHGDALTYPFDRTFDVVTSVATVHHMPELSAALRRLASLTAPGGVLVLIGLARSTRLADFAFDALGVAQHSWLSRRNEFWEHTAPKVWTPPHSYSQVREIAEIELPGARWRRLPLFRYSLIWWKPGF